MGQRASTKRKCAAAHRAALNGTPLDNAVKDAGTSTTSYYTYCRENGIVPRGRSSKQDTRESLAELAAELEGTDTSTDEITPEARVRYLAERQENSVDLVATVEARYQVAGAAWENGTWDFTTSDPEVAPAYFAEALINEFNYDTANEEKTLTGNAEQEHYLRQMLDTPEFAAAWPVAHKTLSKHFPIMNTLDPNNETNEISAKAAIHFDPDNPTEILIDNKNTPFELLLQEETSASVMRHEIAHFIVEIEMQGAAKDYRAKDWFYTSHGAIFRGTLGLLTDIDVGTERGDFYRGTLRDAENAVYEPERSHLVESAQERIKDWKPLNYTNGLISADTGFQEASQE